jgi:S1-C subfamily serine protease
MTLGLAVVALLCLAGLLAVALNGASDDPNERVATQQARQVQPDTEGRPPTGRQPTDLALNLDVTRVTLPSAIDVVELVQDAVVTVISRERASVGNAVATSTGTGFVVDRNGYVVTNAHVVDGGAEFLVVFADGRQTDAELVGADPISDLAVIRVNVAVPAVAPLGDSNALLPGQPVIAIGSPLGAFTNTVTQGVVSAVGRSLAPQPGQPELSGLVQHDAAINPGNSGGPLLNFAGEVIGVNTLGIQTTEDGQPAQGLFFAIPSNTVREIANRLIEDGRVEYPFLGVESLSITPEVAAQNDLSTDYGELVVDVVEDGPAAEAGVRSGDIIVAIDGEPVNFGRSFTEVLFGHAAGERVTLDVVRDGESIEIVVVLDKRPSDGQ